MNQSLPLEFTFSFNTAPVLSWGEGGCSLSNKNKASLDETVGHIDSSNTTDS